MGARSVGSRSIPFLTATALSISIYSTHAYLKPTLLEESQIPSTSKRPIPVINSANLAYIPLGWGNNRYLTLSPDSNLSVIKKPSQLTQFGATPLRDLAISEKYGAAVDANGDCWMWGLGYDPSGEIGRSLKGKGISSLIAAPTKLFMLSKNGKLYAVSPSRIAQSSKQYKKERSWWSYLFGTDPGVDFLELKASEGLKSGERWSSVSTGRDHLLAVTNKGRTFSLPITPKGNAARQLGTKALLDSPSTSLTSSSSTSTVTSIISPDTSPSPPIGTIKPEEDPRFCPTLTEIPSLSGIQITSAVASAYTSFALTSTGRVLGWGANESGQIGLGPTAAIDIVSTPVEVVLARNYPGGTTVRCMNIFGGGNTTMFVIERDVPGKEGVYMDLLACGNGMSGALGNAMWTNACPSPVKVKTISGLQEFSEKDNAYLPLRIHDLSISPGPTAHIFAVLDTVRQAEKKGVNAGLYGKDVMVWGGNVDYQLGNGKRSSLAVPQHLPPLVLRALDLNVDGAEEATFSSGTLSPMPHSRLQLHISKTDAYDLNGKLIKRGVMCEETMVAGWNSSVLYNKIID